MSTPRIRETWLVRRHEALVLGILYATFTSIWFIVGWLLTHPLAHSSIVHADQSISRWFVDRRTPGLNSVSFLGSMLADTTVKIAVTAVVATAMLLLWRRWLEPLMVVIPLILEALCFITVTTLVGRPRPDVVRLDTSPVGSSYPSGHMGAAVAYAAIIVVVFWHTRHRWIRVLAVAFGVMLPVLVGLSRMYRGMHYLTDVDRPASCHRTPDGRFHRPFPTQCRTGTGRDDRAVSLTLVVLLCGVAAALFAFGVSASRRTRVDTVDPAAEEQAVRRSLHRHPRIERFLRARMDRKSAGGFLLTASFLILFVVAIIIGSLLDMIGDNSWLANADRSVAEWGSRHGRSETVDVLKWITQLGSTVVVTASLLATAVVDYVRRRSREVFAFVAAVGLGELVLSNILKVIVRRDRPSVLHLVAAGGYSFPSGHTVAAAAATSAIALVLGRDRSRRAQATLAGGAALIAISVAASRALLGVHWLSDVIAGLAVGWGWFMIVAIIFGGRAQRLGDPVSDNPEAVVAGIGAPSDDSANG